MIYNKIAANLNGRQQSYHINPTYPKPRMITQIITNFAAFVKSLSIIPVKTHTLRPTG